MSASCADLDLFFDGELSKAATRAFRAHLATCERCEAVLRGRMQEKIVAEMVHARAEQPRAVAVKPAPRRRIGILAPLLAAAAVLLIWLIVPREQARSAPVELSLTLEPRGAPRRGSAAPGDGLRLLLHGGHHQTIWVYRGSDEVVAVCPGDARCGSSDQGLTLELHIPAPGQYSIIGLTAEDPIPAPHGELDVMLSAATTAGAHIERKYIDVR